MQYYTTKLEQRKYNVSGPLRFKVYSRFTVKRCQYVTFLPKITVFNVEIAIEVPAKPLKKVETVVYFLPLQK